MPKKFFKKPNVLGLTLHQWQMNGFQITRDNNRCVRENISIYLISIPVADLTGGVLQISSDGEVRRIFGLKFTISGFLG